MDDRVEMIAAAIIMLSVMAGLMFSQSVDERVQARIEEGL